jgi:hypothetical protein
MILECHQCSSCYFEDTEPSSRIAPSAIEARQQSMVFENVLVVFVCIELYDDHEELNQAAREFDALSRLIGKRAIVLCANDHMSIDRAPEKRALELIKRLEVMLRYSGFVVHRLSFGYHKKYGMDCTGNVGSIVGRRFYGSPQKQFLRLLTRLGVCTSGTLPKDMPAWARILSERQLRMLGNRKETYSVAKKMLNDPGEPKFWTCMLFEGERLPMLDYLSTLYAILDEFPNVRVHRALNLSVRDLSEEARLLFQKYPRAIKAGKLRIYSSKVSDIEFLLTKGAVLLAFPKKPQKAGAYAGEISFGIYCKDKDFAKKLIKWYHTFLVDERFGWIRTESELNTTINKLEDEMFQQGR